MTKNDILNDLRSIAIKAEDPEAYWTFEEKYSVYNNTPIYSAYFRHSIQSIEPVMFSTNDLDELHEQIQKYLETSDHKTAAIEYHKAQIRSNQLTIESHEKSIKKLEQV